MNMCEDIMNINFPTNISNEILFPRQSRASEF